MLAYCFTPLSGGTSYPGASFVARSSIPSRIIDSNPHMLPNRSDVFRNSIAFMNHRFVVVPEAGIV